MYQSDSEDDDAGSSGDASLPDIEVLIREGSEAMKHLSSRAETSTADLDAPNGNVESSEGAHEFTATSPRRNTASSSPRAEASVPDEGPTEPEAEDMYREPTPFPATAERAVPHLPMHVERVRQSDVPSSSPELARPGTPARNPFTSSAADDSGLLTPLHTPNASHVASKPADAIILGSAVQVTEILESHTPSVSTLAPQLQISTCQDLPPQQPVPVLEIFSMYRSFCHDRYTSNSTRGQASGTELQFYHHLGFTQERSMVEQEVSFICNNIAKGASVAEIKSALEKMANNSF